MIGYIVMIIVLPISTFIIGYSVGHMQGYKDWKQIIDTKDETIRTLNNVIRIKDKIR